MVQFRPVHLIERVKKDGLQSVEIEIERALKQVEQDPHAAAQFAGNVLEAVLKAYLDHQKEDYDGGATLAELWKKATPLMRLIPANLDNKDLKKNCFGVV